MQKTIVHDLQVETYARTIEPTVQSKQITVRGAIQRSGFRRYVRCLAREHGLTGWVLSYPGGAALEVEGQSFALNAFVHDLMLQSLFLAYLASVEVTDSIPIGYTCFDIHRSVTENECD